MIIVYVFAFVGFVASILVIVGSIALRRSQKTGKPVKFLGGKIESAAHNTNYDFEDDMEK